MAGPMLKLSSMMVGVLVLCAPAFAASTTPVRTELAWSTGWDNFGEPIDTKHSALVWTYNPLQQTLTVDVSLVHATPNKVYQLALEFFCATRPLTFGQFPVNTIGPNGACSSMTRQGVTATVAEAELGVITTDAYGNGMFKVEIAAVALGSSQLKVAFFVHDGTGCNLSNANGNGACAADFQSPGPTFGKATIISAP